MKKSSLNGRAYPVASHKTHRTAAFGFGASKCFAKALIYVSAFILSSGESLIHCFRNEIDLIKDLD
jgi:hypothetical protein